MKILLLDPDPVFENGLRAQGHELKVLRFEGGVHSLPALLAGDGFAPDLLIQQEWLGPRNYYRGLTGISCPTLFWAVDTHLNMFWHQWYGLLFDGVLTPHVSLFKALPASLQPKELHRFSRPGGIRAWKPHAERSHGLALCARMTSHRPIRTWMVELLRKQGLHVVEGLSFDDMMLLYDDSRVVPNECISNEVNFRLMEGASSGCLVLSPDVGEDQNSLLKPGEEFLLYRDGLELAELAAWARAKPVAAEAIGRAAARRIRMEHLPEHRARFAVELGSRITQNRLTGDAADLAFWLVMARQSRNGTVSLDKTAHAERGLAMVRKRLSSDDGQIPEILLVQALAQGVCLFSEASDPDSSSERGFALCRELLARWPHRDAAPEEQDRRSPLSRAELEPAAAASAFCITRRKDSLARAFYALHSEKGGGDAKVEELPSTIPDLCMAWAEAFRERGAIVLPGFGFAPEKGMLPESAFTWLVFARHLEPEAFPALLKPFESLLEHIPAYLFLYLGFLAEHSLRLCEDWRLQQDFGLACIRACRVELGLHELEQASKKAKDAGQERLYWIRLKARGPVQRDWERLLAAGREGACAAPFGEPGDETLNQP